VLTHFTPQLPAPLRGSAPCTRRGSGLAPDLWRPAFGGQQQINPERFELMLDLVLTVG
jgi:hypothetical protein